LRSRSLKIRVSQEPCGPYLALDECQVLAEKKDRSTAIRLQPLLGIDTDMPSRQAHPGADRSNREHAGALAGAANAHTQPLTSVVRGHPAAPATPSLIVYGDR
jgi:hypothetical protein